MILGIIISVFLFAVSENMFIFAKLNLKDMIDMRKLFLWMLVAVLVGAVAACSSKKKSNDIITTKYVKPQPQGPISLENTSVTKEFKWADRNYSCLVERTADDSLPMVKDEIGQQFVDNRIKVTITRADGSTFFQRVFTKKDFDSQLDDDYRETGILEGLVFVGAEPNEVRFAGSVSHPQTDEYIPLVLSINRTGGVSIARDTQMDTSGSDDDEMMEEE